MINQGIFEVLKVNYDNICSLEEIKNFLRISHARDDNLIKNLIKATIEAAENFTGICWVKKNIKYSNDAEDKKIIKLKFSPVSNIIKIIIVKNEEEFILENYEFSTNSNLLYLNNIKTTGFKLNVFYDVGIEKEQIAYPIKQGILEHISAMYDGADFNNMLSEKIKSLYYPYRKLKI